MAGGRRVLLALLSLLATGCSYFRFAPPTPQLYELTYTADDLKTDRNLYEQLSAPDARKAQRDKMLFSVAREIDRAYFAFKTDFFGTKAAADTVLDVAGLGITSAAAFATGGTSQILAAAATGLAGSRSAFNKNFLKEKTPDVLLGRMDALRAERWAAIYQKSLSPDAAYSWYQADRDLVSYYQAGTLEEAFQAIIAESGKETIDAEQRTRNAVAAKYGEFLDRAATEAEMAPLRTYYEGMLDMDGDAQAQCARAVLAAFKASLPEEPINPGGVTENDVDSVAYLQGVASEARRSDVRQALLGAYMATKGECSGN